MFLLVWYLDYSNRPCSCKDTRLSIEQRHKIQASSKQVKFWGRLHLPALFKYFYTPVMESESTHNTLQYKAYGLFCSWTDLEGDGFALMPHLGLELFSRAFSTLHLLKTCPCGPGHLLAGGEAGLLVCVHEHLFPAPFINQTIFDTSGHIVIN